MVLVRNGGLSSLAYPITIHCGGTWVRPSLSSALARETPAAHSRSHFVTKSRNWRIHSQPFSNPNQYRTAPVRQVAFPSLAKFPQPLLGNTLLLPGQFAKRAALSPR